MDYEEFEKLLNEEYTPKLPSRVDSCPPTPRPEDFYRGLNDFEFASDFELNDSFFPSFGHLETTKYKAEEEDYKDTKVAKVKVKKSNNVTATSNKNTDVIDKKALRAERNKRFAKESRDRKRKYVEDLEKKVVELQRTVDYYKERLKKYEIIDRHNGCTGYELYNTLADVYKKIQEDKQPLENNEYFIKVFKETCEKNLKEQRAALKTLTKEMLQILIPFPRRMSIWFAENDTDPYNADKLVKATNFAITPEQAEAIVYYKKKAFPNLKGYNELRLIIMEMSNKIKSIAKELIGCQRRIQLEYEKVYKYVSNTVYPENMPQFKPELLRVYAQIGPNLAVNPELRDYAMESIKEIDYAFENLSLVKTKDVGVTAESIKANQ